jgi:prepilin-type N-terminal cleavage/methylation domain-containing protein
MKWFCFSFSFYSLQITRLSSPSPRLSPLPKAGFTLLELIVALALTGIVMALTGSGLLAIMNANQRHQSEINDRLELEQALAFISDEIKMSSHIDINPSGNNLLSIANPHTFFKPIKSATKIEPILVLTPATITGLTQPIVYYLGTPAKTTVWNGPKVIYRWGPTMMQDGSYSNGDGKSLNDLSPEQIAKKGVEYFNEPLIDGISDRAPTHIHLAAHTILECDRQSSTSVPIANQRNGFYLCVDRSGKAVKIWLHKQPNSGGKTQSITTLVATRSK